MGCSSCGGRRTVGSTSNNPFVIGDNTGPSQRVISTESVMPTMATGRSVWVKGSGVAELISNGTFRLLDTVVRQRNATRVPIGEQRVWRVGAITYTDMNAARNRAAETGEPIEPVSI